MAALYPIRLVPPPRSARTASLRNQMPSFESLADRSACSDRPLVTKGTECAQCCIYGLAAINVRILLSPLWEAREGFLSEWSANRKLSRNGVRGDRRSRPRTGLLAPISQLKSTVAHQTPASTMGSELPQACSGRATVAPEELTAALQAHLSGMFRPSSARRFRKRATRLIRSKIPARGPVSNT
jgi:hypothetical protein